MKQIEKVQREFTKQAKKFDNYQKNFSKEEFNKWAIDKIAFSGTEHVLEVAAGTCALGRMVSPYVRSITELDTTSAMLNIGKYEAQREGLKNLSYVNGIAENLPFMEQAFEIVMSRLAFHHFEDVDLVFSEMTRVLKTNGKLVVIDMEARDENLRKRADEIETLRDPSHVRCISRAEFYELANKYHLKVTVCDMIPIPVSLDAWMDLTQVKESVREQITNTMEKELEGGEKTGFNPFRKKDGIFFNHKWMLFIAEKEV